MSLMYLSTRTYPESMPVATACVERFTRATEVDMRRLIKGIMYLARDTEHVLVIRAASETIVCSAEYAYTAHDNGYSHDG